MSDDLLERATRALRQEGEKEPSAEHSSLVRARVLAQTKRRAQLRPQGLWQWAAVVCLGFFVSTAMAHVIKVQLPRVIEAFRTQPAEPPKAAPKRTRPAQPVQPKAAVPEAQAVPEAPLEAAAPSEPAPVAPLANAAPNVPSQPAPPARTPRPAKTAPRPAPKPAPAPAKTALATALPEDEPPPAPAPAKTALATALPEDEPPPAAAPSSKVHSAESAELTLFRRAQSLHLSKDPKAIEAWDAYLRVAGTSALAPEARYNRALGLVRAQRVTEAKAALAPFAEGKYGSYRREEAQALLARLSK
jgi:hypothetical protein